MSHYNITRRLDVDIAVCRSSTFNTTAVSTNNLIPLTDVDNLVGDIASTITISSNEITLPSGYWWFVKGSPQAYIDSSIGWIRYAWKDTTSNAQYGRSGFLTIQEGANLFGGEELACCLLDCTAASKTIKLNIEGSSSVLRLNDTGASGYSGQTRVLLWRIKK